MNTPHPWSIQLGAHVVPNNLNVPQYPWFPDAHFAMVQNNNDEENDPDSALFVMFWAGNKNYRTIGGLTKIRWICIKEQSFQFIFTTRIYVSMIINVIGLWWPL
jgi:hypothetical protein